MQNKLTNREQSLIEENNDLKRTIASLNRFIEHLKGQVKYLEDANTLLCRGHEPKKSVAIPNGWKVIVNN